jgi:hypothetical protein
VAGSKAGESEAILGKKEELEDAPSSAVDDPTYSTVTRRRRSPKVLVTRYLVQWTGYSMDDCSWERTVNLAGAADLILDYERRLEAETHGHLSVMMLCVRGSDL